MRELFPGTFEIVSQERSWPHRGGTGGFFVSVLKKIAPLPAIKTLRALKPSDHIALLGDAPPRDMARILTPSRPLIYMKHGSSLLATDYSGDMSDILSSMSMIRCGMTLSRTLSDGHTEYLYQSGRDALYTGIRGYVLTAPQAVEWLYHSRITSDMLMPDLLSPMESDASWVTLKSMDGYSLGIAQLDRHEVSARIPKEWVIKRIHTDK